MPLNSCARCPRGFTLIELLVVVAIIAVLGTIAYAAYQNHVLKARRMLAVTCLLDYGQYLQRYRSRHLEFPKIISPTGDGNIGYLPTTDERLAPPACLADLAEDYRFWGSNYNDKGTGNTTGGAHITAYAQGRQEKDKCKSLRWSLLRESDTVHCLRDGLQVLEAYQ